MATTKIWDIKGRLDQVIIYAANPDKTENPAFSKNELQGLRDVMNYATNDFKTEKQFYVTGINCDSEIARQQMNATKEHFQKTDGIIAFHALQSFAKNEVNAQTAHQIGINLAKKIWGERFEVVVATHLNTSHFHNHFVINSVSFMDGKRYYDNNKTYRLFRETSDELCKEYGLSIIQHPQKGKSKHYAEWKAEQDGKPTWRSIVKNDIDNAIKEAYTDTQFFGLLRKQGYEIKVGKDISVRPPGKERFVRLMRNFGEEYSKESINGRILAPKGTIHLEEPKFENSYHKPFQKPKGIVALYYHYQYLMGIRPKNKAPSSRVHFLLKEELLQLDKHDREIRLLVTNNIETKEDLNAFQENCKEKLAVLIAGRKEVYTLLRNGSNPEIIEKRNTLTKDIKRLRQDIAICEGIPVRVAHFEKSINENLKQDDYGKEQKKNELFRRSR